MPTKDTQNHSQAKFIKLTQVMLMTGLSRSAIYLKIKQGIFPPQIKLGERSSAWVESEICAWIENRINQSRGETA